MAGTGKESQLDRPTALDSPRGGGVMALFSNSRRNLARIRRLLTLFVRSKIFPTSAFLFVLILVLVSAQTSIDLLKNFTNRDVFNAVQDNRADLFWRNVSIYVSLFAVLTIFSVLYRYVEERLGLLLRRGLTEFLMEHYLSNRAY